MDVRQWAERDSCRVAADGIGRDWRRAVGWLVDVCMRRNSARNVGKVRPSRSGRRCDARVVREGKDTKGKKRRAHYHMGMSREERHPEKGEAASMASSNETSNVEQRSSWKQKRKRCAACFPTPMLPANCLEYT